MSAEAHPQLSPPNLPERFEVLRRLGSGGFGVVYEAVDKHRDAVVALKHLSQLSPEGIYRFKREFRSLANISHENLVQLYDLLVHDGQWYVTMELVEGLPLARAIGVAPQSHHAETLDAEPESMEAFRGPRYAAEQPVSKDALSVHGVMDFERVRRVFAQLNEGLSALHEKGKLHRDLKCSNVQVTADDHVVLLDFGLVKEVDLESDGRTGTGAILGTPLYMAPEQCAGAPISLATDYYALGTMLFRTLSGSFPFSGSTYELLHQKQIHNAPSIRSLNPSAPDDLQTLVDGLLSRDPAARPAYEQIDRILTQKKDRPKSGRGSRGAASGHSFVGRNEELSQLSELLQRSRQRPQSVCLFGASGIGKTAVVRRFHHKVQKKRRNVWLEGRCYARESLPYKALDGLIDSLARYLLRVSEAEAQGLCPRHVADLVQLFPVIRRVPSFAAAADDVQVVPDPKERQRRAFLALKDLLGRLSDRRPLVLFIDDLQWGDDESAKVLSRLFQGPDAPRALLIGTCRSEEVASSQFLTAFQSQLGETELEAHSLDLVELSPGDTRELARALCTTGSEEELELIANESRGSPLFVDLLARHAESAEASASDEGGEVSIGSMVLRELSELPTPGRTFLELLSVSDAPVPLEVATGSLYAAAGDSVRSRLPTVVQRLQALHLARLRSNADQDDIECYHDRIRQAVRDTLSESRQRDYHRLLAEQLEAHDGDPERLASHHRAAGNLERATEFALIAAERAHTTLAFARAAELFQLALDLGPSMPRKKLMRVREQLGLALEHAGRGVEAARAYRRASELAGQHHRLELQRRAAEQLLFSGLVDEATDLLRGLLPEVGLRFPGSGAETIGLFVARRAQLKLRGQTPSGGGEAVPLSDDQRLRVDTCWSVAIGLSMVDPVKAGTFQAQHLLLALESGDQHRIAKAMAVEVPFSATVGTKHAQQTRLAAKRARELASTVSDPFVEALTESSIGGAAWLEGRWHDAVTFQERADAILRRRCTGAAWQLATANIVLFDSLYRLGRWSEILARYPEVLTDARSRGDRFLEVYLRVKFRAWEHLVQGRPVLAEEELQAAIDRWSQPGFSALHFWRLYLGCEIDLYRRRPKEARRRFEAAKGAVRRAMLMQLQLYRVTMHDLEARIALAELAELAELGSRGSGRQGRQLERRILRLGKRQRAENAPWADVLGAMALAGVAAMHRDDKKATRLLEFAEERSHVTGMEFHAAVSKEARRRIQRSADDGSPALDRWVRDAQGWRAVMLPGNYW
ncbi:MAG: AAA family ATPase [Myxococcota bacterium]